MPRTGALCAYNPNTVQPPTRADFGSEVCGALRPDHFHWGPRPVAQKDHVVIFRAPPPSLPDPYDDDEPETSGRENERASVPRKRQNRRRPQPRARLPARVPTPTPEPPAPSRLMTLPLEVRENIYEILLVAPDPIPVHKGWQRVFARKRPCLETAILRVNRQAHAEAARILYSKNRFLSRLTLPPNNVVNIEALPHNDNDPVEPGEDEEMVDDVGYEDSGDDYFGDEDFEGDDDSGDDDFQPNVAELRQADKCDLINLQEYGCLFRRLAIDVQKVLFEDTRQLMIQESIDVFVAHPAVQYEMEPDEADPDRLNVVLRRNYPNMIGFW